MATCDLPPFLWTQCHSHSCTVSQAQPPSSRCGGSFSSSALQQVKAAEPMSAVEISFVKTCTKGWDPNAACRKAVPLSIIIAQIFQGNHNYRKCRGSPQLLLKMLQKHFTLCPAIENSYLKKEETNL